MARHRFSPNVPFHSLAENWLHQPSAVAGVRPSRGSYCASLRVLAPKIPELQASGGWWPALREQPTAEQSTPPVYCGNPLLFPFAMDISENTLQFQGRHYPLQPSREETVMHGVVRDQTWTVERAWTESDADHIRTSITADSDQMLSQYPFPFRLTATQTLRNSTLTIEIEALNLHDAAIPVGLGIHPYVPFPMVTGGRREDCVVWSDVTHQVQISGESEGALIPMAGPADLRRTPRVVDLLRGQSARRPDGGMMYTYGNQPDDDRGVRWSITDARRKLSVRVETAPPFRSVVLWAPREPTVCVSPVISTMLPNGFNLAAHGHDTGMIELEPGQTWSTWARITAVAQ